MIFKSRRVSTVVTLRILRSSGPFFHIEMFSIFIYQALYDLKVGGIRKHSRHLLQSSYDVCMMTEAENNKKIRKKSGSEKISHKQTEPFNNNVEGRSLYLTTGPFSRIDGSASFFVLLSKIKSRRVCTAVTLRILRSSGPFFPHRSAFSF